MHLILVAVGIALIVFGAVVLLRFSDRPGGSIKWLGMEMSSTGAGLPLVGLGVGCILFAVMSPSGASEVPTAENESVSPAGGRTQLAQGAVPEDCFAAAIESIAADRVKTIEMGMRDVVVLRPDQAPEQPFGIILTENGQTIGSLRVRLFRLGNTSDDLYRIEELIDSSCKPVEPLSNSRGGPPRDLINWDTVRMKLGDYQYLLRIGGEGGVEVGEFTKAS